MISVTHLTKRYGTRLAVDDVSFTIDRGEIVGFVGANGAGKSTTLRILAGFVRMTSGSVTIDGHDVVSESFEARSKIGYMSEAVALYPEMRVVEYLLFRAELKRVPRGGPRMRAVGDAMEKVSVTEVAHIPIGKLSKGYRQRVGLADALVANPPLLILDEPTAGLDPHQVQEVRSVLRGLCPDHTVLLSTHILGEVEASCTRALVLARGRLVAQGAMEEIRLMHRGGGLEVTVRGGEEEARRALAPLSVVGSVACSPPMGQEGGAILVVKCSWSRSFEDAERACATEEVIGALVNAGLFVRDVRPDRGWLESVFAEWTREGGPDP